jgi:ABC-type sugar transport system ATPase subunit
VRALSSVNLRIPPGQVTSLCGDNGAGKSVTIKTISGLWAPDGGELLWEGKPVHLHGPRDAEALGITTIYQDLALCDNLDIVQNMFLGHEPLRRRMLDEATMEAAARQTLKELSVKSVRSIRQPVASLSGGQRQSVAVAKAVMSKAKLVIMDEPTAALGVAQTRMVLDLIKTLAGRGVAVMVVSHNLNDIFEVADQIAVLYLGRLATQGPASDYDRSSVVDYMTTGASARTSGAAA